MIEFIPIGQKRPPPPERKSVDGFVLKVGDVVWCVRFGTLSRCTITKESLRYWSRFDGIAYIDEQQAVIVALEGARKRLNNAKRDVRRETRTIARLEGRLTRWDKSP